MYWFAMMRREKNFAAGERDCIVKSVEISVGIPTDRADAVNHPTRSKMDDIDRQLSLKQAR